MTIQLRTVLLHFSNLRFQNTSVYLGKGTISIVWLLWHKFGLVYIAFTTRSKLLLNYQKYNSTVHATSNIIQYVHRIFRHLFEKLFLSPTHTFTQIFGGLHNSPQHTTTTYASPPTLRGGNTGDTNVLFEGCRAPAAGSLALSLFLWVARESQPRCGNYASDR